MTAQRATELLLDYLDGALDADVQREMDSFIAEDTEFRAFAATYKATLTVTKNALQQAVPADAEQRTLNFLRSQIPSSKVG